MGATNTTANYNLSQFIGTDKPAWLQDYNGDMLKIDTGINAAKVAADGAQNSASAAQNDATTANNAITNTITPAISSLNTTVGNQGGAINTINSLIGNGTPTTTDQTIIGAINEINANVTTLNSGLVLKKQATVSLTGASTYKDVFDAIFTALNSNFGIVDNKAGKFVFSNGTVWDWQTQIASSCFDATSRSFIGSTHALVLNTVLIKNGSSSLSTLRIDGSGNTITDASSTAANLTSADIYVYD